MLRNAVYIDNSPGFKTKNAVYWKLIGFKTYVIYVCTVGNTLGFETDTQKCFYVGNLSRF